MFYFKFQILIRLCSILVLLLLSACSADSHDHPHLTTGKQYFEYHCASCHRENGMGLFLKAIPANILNDKSYSEIVYHIRHGSQSSQKSMPVFKKMPDGEVRKIASYLLQLKNEHIKKQKKNNSNWNRY